MDNNSGHRSQNVSVVTSHYLGGPWNCKGIASFALTRNKVLMVGSDANSPQLVNSYGFLNTSIPIVFSHGSYLTVQDATLLRSTSQYLSITAESERHYGHGDSQSPYIMDQASLGVDTHFTYSTDIIGQARLWLQTVRLLFYSQVLGDWEIPPNNPMSVEQSFYLATRAGGLALHRNDIGVLVEGAKADLVVFDGTSPNMLGWADPVAAVMLHSNVGNIQHVLVDGKFRKRDFRLTVEGDYANITRQFLASARRIQSIWEKTPYPDLTGAWPYTPGINYTRAVTAYVEPGQENGYPAVLDWYQGDSVSDYEPDTGS